MAAGGMLPQWAKRLTDERRARGWVEADLAAELKRQRSDLPSAKSLTHMIRSDWETGRHKPGPRYRILLSAAFDVAEEDLFACPSTAATEQAPPRAPGTVVGIAEPVPHEPHRGPVAPELVMYFLEQLPGHYKADMFLGPRHLIPTVDTQARLIDELTRAADAPVRQGLLGAGVAYSSLLGWLYQDAGDLEKSAQWRNAALDMAHRSADPQLISYALTNKAMLAIDLNDRHMVLDYAIAALADETRLSPKVRVLGLVHQAHGHAFLGDRASTDRALDAAEALLDQVDDEYPWGNSCRRTPGYIDVQRATAYVRLGAHHEAIRIWDRLLHSAPTTARRDNGVFLARQAAALAAIPEPERVVEIATTTATLVTDTGSARLRRELLALPTHAAAWTSTPAGRDLGDIIAAIA
ncbi:hypothetical protein EDD29_5137 [Actinocorallia herbida]|uniref:HTH cro/C1-type domain-containing protein n=1 Tax=Actinocorallia herbida TaxID=58109 RepID=A0A3N1D1X1_9ACTN|nr:helix-turn-helix transcriptional regulator [Actinocorallia herbida]ROO87529.1 hypothetical protein EDD29_5137 [Actinocorallia herbida]